MSSSGGGAFLGLAFLFIGLVLFFKGFFVYRRYRLLADMPRMPIRSLAMGLVEVQGLAIPDRTLLSPITRTPCLCYKVENCAVEQEKGGHTGWSEKGTDKAGGKFFLEDDTGKVLVDPEGADLHLYRMIQRQTAPPQPGRLVPAAEPASDAPADEELNRYGHAFVARQRRWPLLVALKRFWIWAFYNRGGVYRPTGAYQFTEYCLLPYKTYVVAGTCTENPQPRDEQDRNLIKKGKRSPVLLITEGTEKQVESTFRVLSGCAIYGGAILALYSAASLLYALGWLSLPWK